MEPPAKRTRRAQAVLDTVSKLFYANGIHSVGVDRIAAESAVPSP
jgi:AcrR family transcriptional regulator